MTYFEDNQILKNKEGAFVWPLVTQEIKNVVLDQMDKSLSIYNRSGIFEEFENKFKEYHNKKFALLFNSGTSAIHGMIEGLNLDKDDEIICTVYTFFATCSPAMYLGYKIVFCDTDENGNINPKEILNKITAKTKVILLTHMWGNPCQMDEILEIKRNHNLYLLEDCSHAHGGSYKGNKLGTFGDAAAWSLQGQKIITGGEGGILVTNNEEIYYRANLLGHYNKRCKDEIPKNNELSQYAITGFGLKLRAHPLAIAIANQQMNFLDSWIVQKEIYVEKIKKGLQDIPFLSFLDTHNSKPSYYGLIMKYDEKKANNVSREDFVKALNLIGLIEVDIPNSTSPLDKLPFFSHPEQSSKRLSNIISRNIIDQNEFLNAYTFYNTVIKIPIWVRQEDENIIQLYIQGFKQITDLILTNPNKFKEYMIEKQLLDQCNTDSIQKIVVGAVIRYENKTLCVKRVSDDFMGGLVELPSGGKDDDEGVVEGLVREIQEETGIVIAQTDQFNYVDSFDYASGSGKKARQLNFVVTLIQLPEVTLNPEEHSEYYWLSNDELDQYNISDHTKNTILKAL